MTTAFYAAAPCPVEVKQQMIEGYASVGDMGYVDIDTEVLVEQLNSFCHENLSSIKCPRSYEFMDELPRLDNGKLYKRRLQDTYKKKASNRSHLFSE